jgi:hypothetical protein
MLQSNSTINTQTYRRARKAEQENPIDARFEAQKLAFAPLSFQATLALRDLGILDALMKASTIGSSAEELCKKTKQSTYCVETLLEVGVSLKLVKELADNKYALGKVGKFILSDEMTRVNMDFVNDVCYQGAFYLKEAFKSGKPAGLKVLGDWPVIYEGLSELPALAQKSWFDFDHYYSDLAFSEALPVVFKDKPKIIFDIGGNTGKFAIQALKQNPKAEITIIDLPSQLELARQNLEKHNLFSQCKLHAANVLDGDSQIPKGANAVWMSQFLDCFSKEQIVKILKKVAASADDNTAIYILEPLWDKQQYEAASFSLKHTSLYFTCMANGNSKMYSFNEMLACINQAGLRLLEAYEGIGEHDYTLLKCKK